MKNISLIILINMLLFAPPILRANTLDIKQLPVVEKTDKEIKQELELLNKFLCYELKDVEAAFYAGYVQALQQAAKGENQDPDDILAVDFHRASLTTNKRRNGAQVELQLGAERDIQIQKGTSRVSVIILTPDDKLLLLSGETDFGQSDTTR
jgi:hypothetical protein